MSPEWSDRRGWPPAPRARGVSPCRGSGALLLALLAACSGGEDLVAPAPPNVRVSVLPDLTGAFSGLATSFQLTAAVTDTLGLPLASQAVTWSLAAPTSGLAVDADGLLTVAGPVATGDHVVRATVQGVSGNAIVRIFPRPAGLLVFSATIASNGKVFVKNLATDADPVQITDGAGTLSGIGVDAATQMIYFGQGALGTADIFRVHPDGSGLVNLTNDVASQNQGPVVDPVSGWVYFTRRVANVAQVFRMAPDGSGLAQVTTGTQSKLLPAVSPDGARLAYGELFPGFNQEIVVAGIDGSDPVRFTDRTGIDASPVWVSAARLVWSGIGTGGNFDLFGADVPGGSSLQNLTSHPSSDAGPSGACLPEGVTFLSPRAPGHAVFHLDLASGLAVPYPIPATMSVTFARRLCP